MHARKIFTLFAGGLAALALMLPATVSAQGFVDQRSAACDQYGQPPCPPPGQGGTPPGHGGTPPGQGGTPPGQGNGKPKSTKKGSGKVQGTGKSGKKKSGTLGDTDSGSGVAGAGGSGGGPGAGVLGDTTGTLKKSGSLPFTGLEIWMLLALGLAALTAGAVTRRASRRPAA